MATLSREEARAFVDGLTRLLAERAGEAEVRRVMDTPEGYDHALWKSLAEMGVVGLLVDPQYGGAGAGPVEIELAMEAAGAALLCGPLLSSGVLAAGLLQALGDEPAKARLLAGIADGSTIATVALTGAAGTWTEAGVEAQATPSGDTWSLSGRASYVTHGQIADAILVVAKAPDGIGVFEAPAGAEGLVVKPMPTFDHTLRLAEMTFAGTPAQRLEATRPAWDAVEEMLNLARVALAGEQAGGAKRALDMAVDYAKQRIQFGRAIGSFQAIKHMAADLLLESESAISAARAAAQALAESSKEAAAAISLAAFACKDAFSTVTATNIQMHGGIAFTWAHPAHLYLRRARADAQLFGTPAFYRERYLQQLGA
jgi:alkylation response protein AidB-like acyl-CoA dehydrogenase